MVVVLVAEADTDPVEGIVPAAVVDIVPAVLADPVVDIVHRGRMVPDSVASLV